MATIVIMPGGFHPFHAGHYALYKSAVEAFPDADVYVAATADTSTRPFPFPVKEKLAKLAGVPANRFVQVKSPFKAEEITTRYNPLQDTLIFVRSEKDRASPPQPGGIKRDGSPSYLQPYTGKDMEPFARHAYMAYLPTVEFGPGITSASEIRAAWPKLDERRKTALVMSLYPRTQSNPKLAATVRKMLDTAIVGLEEAFPVQPVVPVVPKLPTQQQPKQHTHTLPDSNKKKTTPAAVIHIKEFAPSDGSGDDDPSFNPETFYDIPKLKAVAKRLAQRSVNYGWYDLQLKVLIKYMSEPYIITLDDLEEMFPTAPEIVYYIERNIIKAWPSNEPPYIIKNPNYKPRPTGAVEENQGWAATYEEDLSPLSEDPNPVVDLTPSYPNYSRLLGEFMGARGGKLLFKIVQADLRPGAKPTEKIAKLMAKNGLLAVAPNYVKNRAVVGEEQRTGAGQQGAGMTAGYQRRENQPIDEDYIDEKWSAKYKRSINCSNPQGFSQRAHCAGRKK